MEEIDSIVEQTEASSNNEIPMTEDVPRETSSSPEEALQEFKFNAYGKEIKVPYNDPRLTQWLSMGYEAPNRFGELNKKLADYDKQLKDYTGKYQQLESKYNEFKQIDDWARSNPDKWNALTEQWKQQVSQMNPVQLPPELQQKLEQHDQILTQFQQEQVARRHQAEDQALGTEIESIRKNYPNLDFDAPDQTGRSLEYRILEYATQNGIPSFRAAFRDYCFDQLTKKAEEQGREKVSRTMSQTTKAGLLGKSPAPKQSAQADITGKNYDQIHEMILQSMGL